MTNQSTTAPAPPPYDLQRSPGRQNDSNTSVSTAEAAGAKSPESIANSMEYSAEHDDDNDDDDESEVTDSYVDLHQQHHHTRGGVAAGGGPTDSSVLTASPYPYPDATQTVHEMYLALLYLLSHPSEFQKALSQHPPRGATTLAEWNREYYYDHDSETLTTTTNGGFTHDDDDDDDDDDEADEDEFTQDPSTLGDLTTTTNPHTTPLPFVIFADDAEVVLPQAHTASQLFGLERLEGMELEAAAGVPALSQLFMRWLALMPGGDHLNTVDPPGLTVMRIAGGRYRVTAAHRVVWTWMNEFATLPEETSAATTAQSSTKLQVGDLVTMTIVDVFETDNRGKLLSYCPTFDNRAVVKTHATTETFRKGSSKLYSRLAGVAQSPAAARVTDGVAHVTRLGVGVAKSVHTHVSHQLSQALSSKAKLTTTNDNNNASSLNAAGFEQALSEAEAAATDPKDGTTTTSAGR